MSSRQDRRCRVAGCKQSFADCKHGFADEERSLADEHIRQIVREEIARATKGRTP